MTDAEGEAAETQVWLQYAVKCGYLARPAATALYREYNRIIATLVGMVRHSDTWVLKQDDRVTR